MKIKPIIFTLIVFVAGSSTLPCGPDRACSCDLYNQMDCSETMLPIWKICELISTMTYKNISYLHMERNGYRSIDRLDLKGCDNLYEIYFGENKIGVIEKGAFASLDRITLLDFGNNSLAVYNEKDRQNLTFPPTVKKLMLNGNLKVNTSGHLSYPDLSYLINLEVLHMDGIRDRVIPASYRWLGRLETVELSGLNGKCNITQITNSTLENIPYVRNLNMSSCNIESIDAGAFNNMPHLEILDLSQNFRLGFRVLKNITYSLQFTNIFSLNYSKVHSTFGLGTQIRKQDVCYVWNTSLTEFVLNSNRLQSFETNALMLLPHTVKKMRVEDNIFTFGPYLLQLGCMENVNEVYANKQNTAHNPILFQNEPIDTYNENTRDNSKTYCPYMQNEFLKNISSLNNRCPYFENDKIDIYKNWPMFPRKLKRFEFAESDMKYRLTKFPVLPPLESMEYADASGNILYSWIGPIGPFPNLKYVNLSRNYCSHIESKFFDYFLNVENLQLQENFIGLVLSDEKYGPVVFDKLVSVKVLNLSSNIISFLPTKVFAKMSKLETLDLSVNNIEAWTMDTSTMNSLLHLNLKFNFFHTLPAMLTNKLEVNADRLGKQFTTDLRNNDIKITCEEKEYLKWMVKYKNNMLHFNEYIFHDTTGAKLSVDEFVKSVNNIEKECRSYLGLIVFNSMAITVFLAIVAGGFIYKNRWKLRYMIRITKMRHFGYNKLYNHPKEVGNFMYDAFISYANEDLRFILDKIIPNLERQGKQLCIHDRDFIPGNNIADNIIDAIRSSRKTVVILSQDFLKSKWCLYEFNIARMESIYSRDGVNCLLVVIFGDVPTKLMTTEMLDWIKSNTYIEYTTDEEGELLFWENMKEALMNN
ncbi:toll-like receptor 4 [Mercenaria mercenaria]|uniref:toll-like receptor 4 n=1 Tax=Mercenaria mercenaria TaxID=6596 RepID=UPI00234EBC04|nr:toll-like receptor 4 [Mercenaria mercenaria]